MASRTRSCEPCLRALAVTAALPHASTHAMRASRYRYVVYQLQLPSGWITSPRDRVGLRTSTTQVSIGAAPAAATRETAVPSSADGRATRRLQGCSQWTRRQAFRWECL
jgi:hypothetical protein